jgi:hypothetical protein
MYIMQLLEGGGVCVQKKVLRLLEENYSTNSKNHDV